jgi:hypothetical protein
MTSFLTKELQVLHSTTRDLMSKFHITSPGYDRSQVLEDIFSLGKDDSSKLALCDPKLGLLEFLVSVLKNCQTDRQTMGSAMRCIARLSILNENSEIMSTRSLGLIPLLMHLLENYGYLKQNIYITFGNCIVNKVTHDYLLSEEIGLLAYCRKDMLLNPDSIAPYKTFANAVGSMSNDHVYLFLKLRIQEIILNRLISEGNDPTSWNDRNTGVAYWSLNFIMRFSTLPDGLRAIKDLHQENYFFNLLMNKEKERLKIAIVVCNLFGGQYNEPSYEGYDNHPILRNKSNSLLQTFPEILSLIVSILAATIHYTANTTEVNQFKSLGFAYGTFQMRDLAVTFRNLSINHGNKAILLENTLFLSLLVETIHLFIVDSPEISAIYKNFREFAGGGGEDIETVEYFVETLVQLSFFYEDDVELRRVFNRADFHVGKTLQALVELPCRRKVSCSIKRNANLLLKRLVDNYKSPEETQKEQAVMASSMMENKENIRIDTNHQKLLQHQLQQNSPAATKMDVEERNTYNPFLSFSQDN